MKTRDIFAYSFSAIKLRKLRASLTIIGVAIGITAIVALLSFTQGLQGTITNQLETGLSTDTLIVIPKSGFNGASGFTLLINDTATINGLSPDIKESAVVIQRTVYIQSSGQSIAANIVGVDFTQYSDIYSDSFVAEKGIIPLNQKNDTAVIGKLINDPWKNGTLLCNVGDNIEIIWPNATARPPKNETFTVQVTAVLKEIGDISIKQPTNSSELSQAQNLFGTFFNSFSPGRSISDSSVYVPILKAADFFGTKECNQIIVKLDNSDQETIGNISKAISNTFNGQVTIISSKSVLNSLSNVFSIIQSFLLGIAVIALLVAGIGIMNIMIVSLIERTREIGLLKALGLKSRNVLLLFLSESMIISFIGTPIGIISGWGLANLIALTFSGTGGTLVPILNPTIIFGAAIFGIGASVLFALYPAWRASKLKPVEALRYE